VDITADEIWLVGGGVDDDDDDDDDRDEETGVLRAGKNNCDAIPSNEPMSQSFGRAPL
jgi:hypothetical protein